MHGPPAAGYGILNQCARDRALPLAARHGMVRALDDPRLPAADHDRLVRLFGFAREWR